MRDQTPGRSDESSDEAFSDALDDLFGPEEEDTKPLGVPDQSIDAPHTNPEPNQPPVAPVEQVQTTSSVPQATAPRQGRSMLQVLGFGCAGVLVLIFVCLVILAVIGATVGDPATATSSI